MDEDCENTGHLINNYELRIINALNSVNIKNSKPLNSKPLNSKPLTSKL